MADKGNWQYICNSMQKFTHHSDYEYYGTLNEMVKNAKNKKKIIHNYWNIFN